MRTDSGAAGAEWSDALSEKLTPCQRPDRRRAICHILTSALPLAGCWLLMAYSLWDGYWLTCLLAVPAAGFQLRLSMILHDCAHGSFFASRKANNVLGFLVGVVAFASFGLWRKTHLIHHATSGDLARRWVSDVKTLTVREYASLFGTQRRLYRICRNPFFICGLGVFLLFLVVHRFSWKIPAQQHSEAGQHA